MRRLDLDAAKAKTRTAKAEKLPTVSLSLSLSLSECVWKRRDRGLRMGNHLCVFALQAEDELRKAQAEFDAQLEKTRSNMKSIVQTHVSLVGLRCSSGGMPLWVAT